MMSKIGNIFNQVAIKPTKSNTFDLTHDVKMSMKFGELTPIMVMECVPGDRVQLGADALIRMAPMVAPVMHRMDATIHYFSVPMRILWPNWKDYITNKGTTGGIPQITIDSTLTDAQKRFLDFMGVPPCPTGGTATDINAMPLAAYLRIYNEYYRDENLVTEIPSILADGVNGIGEYCTMRKRSWEHDYFTSALPFAQKGDAVDLPIGNVVINPNWNTATTYPQMDSQSTAGVTGAVSGTATGISTGLALKTAYNPHGQLVVEPTTVVELRRTEALQKYLEKLARGGSRYIEYLKSVFNVNSSDKRQQRPEYITGIKCPLVISEVLATGGNFDPVTTTTPTAPPVGSMSGHGVGITEGFSGSYYAEEHCYIIGIMSVLPRTAYQQGIPKHYLKSDPLDFFIPELAHIGEQAIENQEVFAYTSTKKGTFGYTPRYAEYKYFPGRIAGEMRTTLKHWHLGRIFASQPALSQQFIECVPADADRIFAVNSDIDNLYCHVVNKVIAKRPMPVFGTPQL